MSDKYMVLIADEIPYLVERVNKVCKKGWQPQGGVSVARKAASPHGFSERHEYFQAMVRINVDEDATRV